MCGLTKATPGSIEYDWAMRLSGHERQFARKILSLGNHAEGESEHSGAVRGKHPCDGSPGIQESISKNSRRNPREQDVLL